MSYPALTPSSRRFESGDYPVQTFNSQSGVEVRILRGSKRTGMTLALGYQNLADTQVAQFLTHYDQMLGTFYTFDLSPETTRGWTGGAAMGTAGTGNRWRYAKPPAVENVRPGISSVTVELIGVLG
jgi:hypothetical protein